MNEIYWVTRLDSINTFMFFAIVVCITFIIVNAIRWFFHREDYDDYDDRNCESCKHFRKNQIIIGIISIILSILMIFIPSTKEAYTIYGVGGIIDYVQDNDTAKQLPDKAIQALDKLMDEYLEEEK